jgi:hypothetical protein
VKVLDINNSIDFYAKLLAEFDDFIADQASARHAMNCAITAHHMYDWIWVDFLKADDVLRQRLGIGSKKSDFAGWVAEKSPWFAVVQSISNGSKHFIRQYDEGIERIGGFGMGGFGGGPFGKSYLAIDTLNEEGRFLPLSHVFEAVICFWRDFFRACGKAENLPIGKTQLSD